MRLPNRREILRVFPTRMRANDDTEAVGRVGRTDSRDAFFVRQDRMLDPLLAWGIGSVIAGTGLAVTTDGFRRGIGLQSALWGLISAGFALGWQCTARRNAIAARSGELGALAIQAEARRFEHALALKTGLGAVYVAAGTVLAIRGKSDGARGSGVGVIIQGGALLAFDFGATLWAVFRPETRFET
ncbi:MAG: hypothetical protein DCC58_14740 [Chloroflexi bacterium]|nr:MAG: hypothetical protein DCC58_14740 [Chloroflexota bacterium]